MLLHPTLDLLNELGLTGMAKGFQNLDAQPEARALDHAQWLGLLLDQEVTLRRQKRKVGPGLQGCAMMPVSRMSIIKRLAASTVASSSSSARATGSVPSEICSSPAHVASGKAFLPARLARKPAAKISLWSITGPPDCSPC